jgi:hypothetical protein
MQLFFPPFSPSLLLIPVYDILINRKRHCTFGINGTRRSHGRSIRISGSHSRDFAGLDIITSMHFNQDGMVNDVVMVNDQLIARLPKTRMPKKVSPLRAAFSSWLE